MSPTAENLTALACAGADPAAARWLAEGLAGPFTGPRLGALYAGAGRRFGERLVALGELAIPGGVSQWPASRVARAALLVAIGERLEPDAAFAVIDDLFYRGDSPEREAVLACLSWLGQPERFLDLAVEACRTNVESVFAAIACDNPFPQRWFSEAAFNQMTLKALFIRLPLARIVGLQRRMNRELIRMVGDYAAERRAAGRALPGDIHLILDRA